MADFNIIINFIFAFQHVSPTLLVIFALYSPSIPHEMSHSPTLTQLGLGEIDIFMQIQVPNIFYKMQNYIFNVFIGLI